MTVRNDGYKISSVRVRNFKGLNNSRFYKYSINRNSIPIILSGPNGYGKTTFFDAVELSLTQKITRFNEDLEFKNKKLNSNVLLNDGSKNGYIVLELVNEANVLTIITKIDKRETSIQVAPSLSHFFIKEKLSDSELTNEYLDTITFKKEIITEQIKLGFSSELYNMHYYVSQEETVHFLKNKINDRGDELGALLRTEWLDEKLEEISSNYNFRKGSSEFKIEITRIDDQLSLLKEKYTKLIKDSERVVSKKPYEQLLEYEQSDVPFEWDKNLDLEEEITKFDLEEINRVLLRLHYYYKHALDHRIYEENGKLIGLSENTLLIQKVKKSLRYYQKDRTFDNQRVLIRTEKLKDILAIRKYAEFIVEDFSAKAYNQENLLQLQKERPHLLSMNVSKMTEVIEKLKTVNDKISLEEKEQRLLIELRENLHRHIDGKHLESCPYCNYRYNDYEELNKNFNDLTKLLTKSHEEDYKKRTLYINEINEMMKNDLEKIEKIRQEIDKNTNEINEELAFLKELVSDEEVISRYLAIIRLFDQEVSPDLTIEYYKEQILSNKKEYIHKDYLEKRVEYRLEEVPELFSDRLSKEQSDILDLKCIENKIAYLDYFVSNENLEEITSLEEKIRNLLSRKHKIDRIKDEVLALQKIYERSLKDYKDQVINRLRVPLLVYSSKLLQDYQGGLGVFIDEYRFVSTKGNHDILNTFSSGQLSAFVLAFTLAMNRLYVPNEIDALGFILIDDPVQTMDDINISSLIDLLRNDFSDKQIFLSTHEPEVEYYFLYRFMKYGLNGQSINVKDKFLLEFNYEDQQI